MDLDGTLYSKGAALPGAAQALRLLREKGLALRFLSNTDSVGVRGVVYKAAQMGLVLPVSEVLTPPVLLRRMLDGLPDARCLVLASPDVRALCGSTLVDPRDDKVTHVVVGGTQEHLSYAALDAAYRAVGDGAALVALH
ncbi:MAG: TIGR01458 family HAD-type hydrolase, partial [Actinomycetota bacterium]|nr:TIGR01458 family HAD-type hydrolase [Actinomycetota bacterium]